MCVPDYMYTGTRFTAQFSWTSLLAWERVDRFPRTAQREHQRFSGYAGHEGANQPAESVGNIAGKRNRFEFDVDASITLPEAPVRIDPP
jgi:hypothetical protein